MKYIIDIEDEPRGGLYKAKNFRSLVFDENGLKKLTPYEDVVRYEVGDEVRGEIGEKYVVVAVYSTTVKVVNRYGDTFLFRKDSVKKTGVQHTALANILEALTRGE